MCIRDSPVALAKVYCFPVPPVRSFFGKYLIPPGIIVKQFIIMFKTKKDEPKKLKQNFSWLRMQY